jgi:PAS domain S-box-containing protein
MQGFWAALFAPTGLTPHGFCLAWQPGLLWLHAVSDVLIALSYYSIPVALAVIARRRRDLAYPWVFWLFAAFIAACGTTHLFGALTLWVPAYWPDGVLKAGTAVLSLATASLLWPLIPRILAIPSADQLRQVNRELAESEARYRDLFTHAPVAMHSLDARRRVLDVSDMWTALLGYGRSEVIGKDIAQFQTPESVEAMCRDWPRAAREGALRDAPRRFVCKSGEILDIALSLSSEPGQNEADWRSICSLTDVTARTRAEAALRESEEKLRQSEKLTALGQLAGGIAHDFNNVLQTVQGGADLIRTRAEDSVMVRRVAQMVLDAARRGASVSRRLLVFVRREALAAEPIACDHMLEGMREVLSHTLGAQVKVVLDVAPGVPAVLADRGQLETALVNLATNARDAMPGGGVITLAASAESCGEVPPRVRLSVRDAGMGMTGTVLARATEPFFTTKPHGSGTGLGLAMARNFAEQSGGQLIIDSAPGQGTEVALLLPVAASLPKSQFGEKGAPGRSAVRVLLVDDEALVREIVAGQLAMHGFEVFQAEGAETALAVLEAGQPIDLLVSDLAMPGMDGVALIRASQYRRPGLPAILLTGFASDPDDLPRGGGFSVLRKPVTGAQLAHLSHNLIHALPHAHAEADPS